MPSMSSKFSSNAMTPKKSVFLSSTCWQ